MGRDDVRREPPAGAVAMFFVMAAYSFLLFAPLAIVGLARSDTVGYVLAAVAGVLWLTVSFWVSRDLFSVDVDR